MVRHSIPKGIRFSALLNVAPTMRASCNRSVCSSGFILSISMRWEKLRHGWDSRRQQECAPIERGNERFDHLRILDVF